MTVRRKNEIPKIMLVGKLRAGKDAVAGYLVEKYGFTRFAFGDALKRKAHDVFMFSDFLFREGKPRALYQQFGEYCRKIDPLVWVRYVDAQVYIAERTPSTRGIVVSDGRQPHEIDWARKNGFKIVRVTAPDHLRVERARQAGDVFSEEDLRHDTEQWVDRFVVDYEVNNNGDIRDLERKIDEMMTKLLSDKEAIV